MTAFFDTSVLVAAFLGDHPHHVRSAEVFSTADPESLVAVHSLAEVYSTLTSIPLRPMISPAQAMVFVDEIRRRLTAIALGESEYYEVIQQISNRSIGGGTVYDALILRCALKAKAEIIYTWNLKHFRHLAPELGARIKTP